MTNPAFIEATTHLHYLYNKKYYDELIGVDVSGDECKGHGDAAPDMNNYTTTKIDNDEVIVRCKKLQLMAFCQDAKGNVIGLSTKTFFHGSVVPVSAMLPGAMQLK